jgi:hypothetical protein
MIQGEVWAERVLEAGENRSMADFFGDVALVCRTSQITAECGEFSRRYQM